MNKTVFEKQLEGEEQKILLWAENVKTRLGPENFQAELIDTITHQDIFTICTFEVHSTLPSKVVKEAIRLEADPFRSGRLFFHAYNDITKRLHLLFYSYFLVRKGSRLSQAG